MSFEAHKLIGLSLSKIAQSRASRCGISLHKNLLVATVLHKARYLFMEEAYHNIVNGSSGKDSTILGTFNDEPAPSDTLCADDLIASETSDAVTLDGDEIVVDDSSELVVGTDVRYVAPPPYQTHLLENYAESGDESSDETKYDPSEPIKTNDQTNETIGPIETSFDIDKQTIDANNQLKRRHDDDANENASNDLNDAAKKFKSSHDKRATTTTTSDLSDVVLAPTEQLSDNISDKTDSDVTNNNNVCEQIKGSDNVQTNVYVNDAFLGHTSLVNDTDNSSNTLKPTSMEIDRLSSLVSIFTFSNLSESDMGGSLDLCTSLGKESSLPAYLAMTV